MSSVLIDPRAEYLSSFLNLNEKPSLTVVMTDKIKEKIYKDVENVLTFSDLYHSWEEVPLESGLCRFAKNQEGVFLYNTLRHVGSVSEARQLYWASISWWNWFFNARNPGFVFSSVSNHGMVFDFVPEIIARYYSITYFRLYPVFSCAGKICCIQDVNNNVLIPLQDESGSNEVQSTMQDYKPAKKRHKLKTISSKMAKEKRLLDIFPLIFDKAFGALARKSLSGLFTFWFVDYTGGGVRDVMFKKHHHLLHDFGAISHLKLLSLSYFFLSSLIKPYSKRDKKRNTLFIALHLEPEATLNQVEISDQLHFVRVLHAAKPDNWNIVVKEHPQQFSTNEEKRWYINYNIKQFKNYGFYEQLAELRDVYFAPLSMSSAKLIDECQAVASLTGSVTFEGVLKKKPAAVGSGSFFAELIVGVAQVHDVITAKKFFKDSELDQGEIIGMERQHIRWNLLLEVTETNKQVVADRIAAEIDANEEWAQHNA